MKVHSQGEKPPRRILQLQGAVANGGAERHTAQLAVGLRDRLDADVHLVGAYSRCPALADWLRDRGMHWLDLDLPPHSRRADSVLMLARMVREQGIDLVHSHLRNADLVAGAVAAATGAPWVATLHGPTFLIERRRQWRNRILSAMHARMLRATAAGAIAISRFVRRFAWRELGLPPERIEVVYNGTDVERFTGPADRDGVRRELDLPPDLPIVMLLGELTPRKGPAWFVHAAAHAVAAGVRAAFVLVGEGRLRAELERLTGRLGLGDQVRFTGARHDAPRLLKAADMLAVTSFNEGFGRVVTEAMAAGKPVVTFDGSGPAELVRDGVTGFVVPEGDERAMADRLAALIASPDLADRLGRNGREHMHQAFTMDCFVDATAEALTRLLAAQRRRQSRRAA